MTQILVTGGTGRIGLPLVTALVSMGHSVRVLALPDDPRASGAGAAGAELLFGSVVSPESCAAAVEGVEAVYHLAGQLPQRASDESIFEINVRGTWNLLKAAAERTNPLSLFVFASTDDVYSSVDARYTPVDENHPRRPVSTYGLSKVIGEDIASYYHIRRDVPVAVARFGLTQLAHELLDGITAQYFLLSARVEALREGADRDQTAAAHLAQLERVLDERGEQAIALRDEQGAPWILQLCDVSDLVGGLVLYLERASAAIGGRFNMSSAAPYATDVAAAHLARIAGIGVLDVAVPGPRLVIDESIGLARSVLGYDPQLTITDILDRAVEAVGPDHIRRRVLTA